MESFNNAYIQIKPFIEIAILWFVFYRILIFFEGTRAFQVLRGIVYLIVAYFISYFLGLDKINWLLTKFFGLSIVALLIIFQQELRQGLARLGQQHLFNLSLQESELFALIDEIVEAVYKLAKKKTGCLISFERAIKLDTYIESGIALDSKITAVLIQSIFNNHSPLHDGGMIIRGDRIIAVSCLFPLTENPIFSKIIGTRHRAAIGLTEQTDALVLMISEETSEIAVALDGRFIPVANREKLVQILQDTLVGKRSKKQ